MPEASLSCTLTQVFSCKFWEIFKNIFFTEHFCTTAFKPILDFHNKFKEDTEHFNELLANDFSIIILLQFSLHIY